MTRTLSLAVLLAMLIPCVAGSIDINLGQPVTLKYLIKDGDGIAVEVTSNDCAFFASEGSGTTLDQINMGDLTFSYLGLGIYSIGLPASLTDELGALNTILIAEPTPGTIYSGPREDVVVYAASQWQGVPVRVFVHDANSDPLPDATVQITNESQTIYVDQKTTDVDGYADFVLASDSTVYAVRTWGIGLSFPDSPDTMTVSGPMSFSVQGESFIPDAPSAPSLGNVYGWLIAADGVARTSVTLSFSLAAPSSVRPVTVSDHRLVTRRVVTTTTDSNGGFSVDLIPTSSMLPTGLRYKVTISDTPTEVFYIDADSTSAIVAGESKDISELL